MQNKLGNGGSFLSSEIVSLRLCHQTCVAFSTTSRRKTTRASEWPSGANDERKNVGAQRRPPGKKERERTQKSIWRGHKNWLSKRRLKRWKLWRWHRFPSCASARARHGRCESDRARVVLQAGAERAALAPERVAFGDVAHAPPALRRAQVSPRRQRIIQLSFCRKSFTNLHL